MTLTDEQRAAVEAPGSVDVVAGAGSGKTTVLVHRIAWMIEHGADPSDILCLTFTRSACASIAAKLEALGVFGVRVSTYHALAASIVVPEGFRVATETESDQFLRSLYEGPRRRRGLPGISEAREALSKWEAGHGAESGGVRDILSWRQSDAKLCATWDLLPLMKAWATEDAREADLVASLPRYPHVLCDEHQDATLLERAVPEMLGAETVFRVGDPRQAIFGWRHAGGWVPERPLSLTRSHRFGREIAGYANAIAARFGGAPVVGCDAEGEVEVLGAGTLLGTVTGEGMRRSSVLVLARTNRECSLLTRELAGVAKWARRDLGDPLASDADAIGDIQLEGKAAISTVHGAKGRESDCVFLCLDMGPQKDAEEERIRYVAATRARRQLVVVETQEER